MSLRTLLRTTSWLGMGLFLVALVPGLWVFAGEPGWPGYFAALRVHVLAGTALVAVGVPATLAHLWLTGSRPLVALILPGLALGGLWGAMGYGAGLHWLQDGYLYPWISSGVAAGAAAAALAAVALAVQLLPRITKAVPTRWSGIGLAVAAGAAIALGLAGDRIRGDARWGALVSHSAVSWACLWFLLLHLRAVRAALSARGRAVAVVALVLAVALASAAWVVRFDAKYFAGFTEAGAEARWTTLTLPATAEQRAAPPANPFPAGALGQSASCGASGCHEALTAQWSGSAHRFAADNALYRAAVGALVDARGPNDAVFCANCHDPERALGGTVATDYADGAPPPGDGVSCIACHAAYDAPHPARNGIARFRLPRPYPGDTEEQRNANLLADPRLHRQSMQASRHLMSDDGCGVCHNLQLGEHYGVAQVTTQNAFDPDAPFDVSCNLCHMPVRTPQPGGRMPQYDHRWPGNNLDLPAYVTHPDADPVALAAQVEAVAAFHLPRRADQLPDGDDNREFASYRDKARGEGLLQVRLAATRNDGDVSVTISTVNHRAGHPFPSGPFDLQEVWMEILIQDPKTGETLAQRGSLVDGRVPGDALRLGARELDLDGAPLRQHRIDRLGSLQDKRLARPGEAVVDTVSLTLAADAGQPLLLSVGWWFRRANPDFAEFAQLPPFPAHLLGSATTAL